MYNRAVKTNLPKFKNLILLVIIFSAAAVLRLTGLNWDQGHLLHPDERFLAMVVNDLDLPNSWQKYFNPSISSLNPRNQGYNFYVYGNWPLSLNKLISYWLNFHNLQQIVISGRIMSAVADLVIVLLVFKSARILGQILKKDQVKIKRTFPYWAATAYTLMVLPIQQSHFFTTDTFTNLFSFAGFYWGLQFYQAQNKSWGKRLSLLLAGLCWGLAVAAKINAILIGPLVLAVLLLADKNLLKIKQLQFKQVVRVIVVTLIFLLTAYFSLRFSSPYFFADSHWLQLNLSPDFLNNLRQLKSWEGSHVWYPPAMQWINRTPIWFALKNMALIGVGLSLFVLVLIGLVLIIKTIVQKIKSQVSAPTAWLLSTILLWALGVFAYQSTQFVKSLRYFLILYPFMALAAGWGFAHIWDWIKQRNNKLIQTPSATLLLLTLVIWPLMFLSIYIQPHSRIQASHWIYQNLPANSMIATEYWDDGLPLRMPQYQKQFRFLQMPVFGKDNQNKWRQIEQILNQADYYVLSSNRAWGSISRLPEKYPRMSRFYQKLLSGQTDYELMVAFNSYPSLKYLGIPISLNDSWAEEAFSVYDHPQVMIFKLK